MLIIDRIEGEWAVIECGGVGITFNMPAELLPPDAKEGDIIRIKVDIDREATRKAVERAGQLLEEYMEDE